MPLYAHAPFRDETGPPAYPFADGSALTTRDGLALDPALLVDAAIYAGGGGVGLRLAAVERPAGTRTVILHLGDVTHPRLASCSFDSAAPPARLGLVDPDGLPAGLLVVDPARLGQLGGWAPGVHEFPAAAAQFAASCTLPRPAVGVDALVAGGETATGDVCLIGGAGVVLSVAGGVVRLDVVGDPYWRRAACAGSGGAYVAPTYLRTINGVGPDVHGNFSLTPLAWLTADPVLRVRAEAGGLVLSSFGKGA